MFFLALSFVLMASAIGHVETGTNSQSVYTLLTISALSACLAAVAAKCAGFHVAQSLLLPRAQETAWDISILYALNHWGHIAFSAIFSMAIFKGLVVEACDPDVIKRMWRAVSFMTGFLFASDCKMVVMLCLKLWQLHPQWLHRLGVGLSMLLVIGACILPCAKLTQIHCTTPTSDNSTVHSMNFMILNFAEPVAVLLVISDPIIPGLANPPLETAVDDVNGLSINQAQGTGTVASSIPEPDQSTPPNTTPGAPTAPRHLRRISHSLGRFTNSTTILLVALNLNRHREASGPVHLALGLTLVMTFLNALTWSCNT
ncbi:hypothetical protein VTJ04DRAFT_5802 [Mycothermus thermophilus]|uniref:uncharacterized protein n=1 Tax=Humicola insolens TaxID=85995 RepID=UPI0037437760